MKVKHVLIAVAAVAMMLLSACSSDADADAGIAQFAGAWGEEDAGEPSLTIAEDGSFNGTDGCNSLVGKGDVADGTFEFGDFATTLMACEDVDDWLSGASTATVSGDTLTVFDSGGAEIGALDKR